MTSATETCGQPTAKEPPKKRAKHPTGYKVICPMCGNSKRQGHPQWCAAPPYMRIPKDQI